MTAQKILWILFAWTVRRCLCRVINSNGKSMLIFEDTNRLGTYRKGVKLSAGSDSDFRLLSPPDCQFTLAIKVPQFAREVRQGKVSVPQAFGIYSPAIQTSCPSDVAAE